MINSHLDKSWNFASANFKWINSNKSLQNLDEWFRQLANLGSHRLFSCFSLSPLLPISSPHNDRDSFGNSSFTFLLPPSPPPVLPQPCNQGLLVRGKWHCDKWDDFRLVSSYSRPFLHDSRTRQKKRPPCFCEKCEAQRR